jgi:phage terminase large subunit-like protein
MTREEKLELIHLLEEKKRREKYRLIDTYFPETGPLRRELYKKHMEFFAAGKKFEERLALAANRIGKTETMGGYEVTMHLTGEYPDWWPGRRYDRPTEFWAGGKSGQTVRDIIQKKLLGPKHDMGSGLIKKELIVNTTARSGIAGAVDTVFVRHKSGGVSELGFKSYDQGRQSFEGTKKDGIWLDEECPLDIYTECLLRTTDTSGKNLGNGMILFTFTPLMGMSEVVLSFLPNGEIKEAIEGPKFVLMATWDDVPHLTEDTKKKLLASIPAFQRDARSKGVPQLGAGAIYPVPEDDYLVDPFEIPKHWPRVYGMDVGWNRTAVIWGALDRETSIVYLYSEHYRGEEQPVVHAEGIKSRGVWIPGVLDPASRGRSQTDGQALYEKYISAPCSLDLQTANNAVETGIYAVWERLSSGKLKVFKNLSNWRSEVRLYRRDESGKIVKANDHIMDATRYLIMSGLDRAKVEPVKKEKNIHGGSNGAGGWMG